MSVNFKIENPQKNPFFASYNRCIYLGVEKISQVFNFNAEENEDSLILTGILKNKLGSDSIVKIQAIVKKLQGNETLTTEEKLTLGMAYNTYRKIKTIEEKKLHVPEKEAHFSGRLIHHEVKGPLSKLGKSRFHDTTEENTF
jgi:hypothetical protein